MIDVGIPPAPEGGPIPRPTLFVETTAHFDLALGDPAVAQALRETLAAYETWTSTYALMEFRRTAVHALKVVRRLIPTAPDDHGLYTWLLRAIDRGHSGGGSLLTPRQRQRSRNAVYMVMDRFGGIPASRKLALGLLDATIQLVEGLALASIERTVNETDCDLVRPERPQGQRWPLSCNARQARCQQSAFLERHRPSLQAVLNECAADPEFGDPRMLEVLRAILNTIPLHASGQERCWRIADLIMVLEALPATRLLSSNRKHFEPICRALGVALVTYSPYPAS